MLNNRQEVIGAFKTGIFPYIDGFQTKKESEEESEEKKLKKKRFKKRIIEYIENESKGVNYDLFKNYFNVVVPSVLARELYETKNKNKNNELVKEIKNRWSNVKDEIKEISENEKEIEQPNKILKIVEQVLENNRVWG